jgi:hypothetical protein
MNKIGGSLCFLYLMTSIVCILLAFNVHGDFKGEFILLQLPIAMQLALLDSIGMRSLILHLPSTVTYFFIVFSPHYVFIYWENY